MEEVVRRKMNKNWNKILLLLFFLLFMTGCPLLALADWQQETGWRYYDESGNEIRDQWVEGKGGKRYYIDENGWMVNGWYAFEDGKQYFFRGDGAAVTGLAEIDGKLYWFEEDGTVFFGEKVIQDQTYHFTPEGMEVPKSRKELPSYRRYSKEGQSIEEGTETGSEALYFRWLPMILLLLYSGFLAAKMGKGADDGKKRGEEEKLRLVLSAANVLAVSGLVSIYGLFDDLFFNKTLCSVMVFLVSMILLRKVLQDIRRDRRRVLFSFFLSFLLALTEVAGMGLRIFANDEQVLRSVTGLFWMFLSAIPLSCLAEPFFFFLFGLVKEKEERECPEPREANRVFWKSWLAVFGGYIPCFLAFFPGLYCYDMIWQWAMYVDRNYNTHHPILHSVLGGWLLETGNRIFGSYNGGVFLYALIQLLIFSGCIAFGLRFLYKIGISKKCRLAVMGFYILYPFFPVLGISTTKDVIFAGLFLVVFVGICDMVNNRQVYKGWRLAVFILFTVLMGLYRNNAVYGLLFLDVCLFAGLAAGKRQGHRTRMVGKLALVLLVSVIGIRGMFTTLRIGFHANKGSVVEMLSVPFQQLARTYVFHNQEIGEEDKEILFRYIPEEALGEYKYYLSDPVKGAVNSEYLMDHKKDFIRLWGKLGLQYPKEYILATVYNTFGIWYLGGDSSCYVEYKMSPPFDSVRLVETHSLIPPLKFLYSWFTDLNIKRWLPILSIVFYTSFYAWTVVVCTVVIVMKKQYIYLILPLYLAGYLLTLALGPCMTMRYMLSVVLCTPLLVLIVFREMGREP